MGNAAGALQSMKKLTTGAAEGNFGFAEIYGGPTTATPYPMTSYYDIQGIIEYQITYDNIDPSTTSINVLFVEYITGYNYTVAQDMVMSPGTPYWPSGVNGPIFGAITVPSGTQWHYRRMGVVVEVTNMRNAVIDVFLDTNFVGTIPSSGSWTFDNGGNGYNSSYGSPLDVRLQGF
jgi:hypothetical protein